MNEMRITIGFTQIIHRYIKVNDKKQMSEQFNDFSHYFYANKSGFVKVMTRPATLVRNYQLVIYV